MSFVEGKRHFKLRGTACYHHSHPCKQVQRPPWQSQYVCLCMCVWRSTIYPVGIGEVDQCMFFSLFTHLPTVTTTTPLTSEAHTHQGCKSSQQGTQRPLWTQRVGSFPENISPRSLGSQRGRSSVLSLHWTHKEKKCELSPSTAELPGAKSFFSLSGWDLGASLCLSSASTHTHTLHRGPTFRLTH